MEITKQSHIFQHIFSFIPPSLRSFALSVCSAWKNSIVGTIKFTSLTSSEQAEVATGHGLAFLKYILQEYDGDYKKKGLCGRAAKVGDLEMLKYLHTNNFSLNEKKSALLGAAKGSAAQRGHLDCLELAHENGCEWKESKACEGAAGAGHLECLKYAHMNGCEWRDNTCDFPYNSRFWKMTWKCNENACVVAARGGHLECLKYAHENGCQLTFKVLSVATEGGFDDCVEYARFILENE